MTGDDERGILDVAFTVERNEGVRPWLAGLLSLLVPGLGQLYLGQYVKGVTIFVASAGMFFCFGLANVVIALDAWSIAHRLRERDIQRSEMSGWLFFARILVRMGRALVQWGRSLIPRWGPLGRPLRVAGAIRLPDVVGEHVEASGEGTYWLEDARAEHASAATFARLSLELMALGAPPALVRAAHIAALDELAHAEVCFSVAGELLGQTLSAGLLDCHGPLRRSHRELALDALIDGCLGEGFGAAVASRASRSGERGAILAKIADDEARHAELAWDVLAWAINAGGPDVARTVSAALRSLPTRMERSWRLTPEESAEAWVTVQSDVIMRARRLVEGTPNASDDRPISS